MRLLRLAIPVALLSLVVACGSNNTTTSTPPAAAPTSAPATSSGPTGSSEPSSPTGSAQVLTGLVGNASNPEAFEITLKDATGDVTTLKAGKYQITVKDASKLHNFHLTGTGVEETTGPPTTLADPTWSVTLTAGEYTYKCDPHPNMVKTFKVT